MELQIVLEHSSFTFGVGNDIRIAAGGAASVSFASATKTITISSTNTTYSAGGGLTLTGTSFAHADTSSLPSLDNSNGTVIQDVTVDGYGHVSALGSVDLDGRYYTETEVNTLLDGKQNTLTNPVTGTGTSGYISKWNGSTTQNNSIIYDDGTNV